jgi:hypothetical protein
MASSLCKSANITVHYPPVLSALFQEISQLASASALRLVAPLVKTERESNIGFHPVIILNGEPNYPIAQISALIEAIGIQRIDNPITYYLREIGNS